MCSENKGADQLRSYCGADLRLCLCIGKNPVFLMAKLILFVFYYFDWHTNRCDSCISVRETESVCAIFCVHVIQHV